MEYNVISYMQSTDPALLVVRNNQHFFQKQLTAKVLYVTIEAQLDNFICSAFCKHRGMIKRYVTVAINSKLE
jgi:hypothetical protein